MNKYFFLIAIAIFPALALTAQKLTVQVNYVTNGGATNSNSIYYESVRLLVWDDFKGRPLENSDAAALTNAGIGINLAFHNAGRSSQLVIDVNCNFSRKDSWVKDGNKTSYILNHEQKHFDIAYLHTILFIQKLKNASFTNSNYAAVIEKNYKEAISAMSSMQNQYDGETNHSIITEKQLEWDEKVSKQLELAIKE